MLVGSSGAHVGPYLFAEAALGKANGWCRIDRPPFAEKHRMFAPANQPAFTLALDGSPSDFKVFAFNGTEAISQP